MIRWECVLLIKIGWLKIINGKRLYRIKNNNLHHHHNSWIPTILLQLILMKISISSKISLIDFAMNLFPPPPPPPLSHPKFVYSLSNITTIITINIPSKWWEWVLIKILTSTIPCIINTFQPLMDNNNNICSRVVKTTSIWERIELYVFRENKRKI